MMHKANGISINFKSVKTNFTLVDRLDKAKKCSVWISLLSVKTLKRLIQTEQFEDFKNPTKI